MFEEDDEAYGDTPANFFKKYASRPWASTIKLMYDLAEQLTKVPEFRREFTYHLAKEFFDGNPLMKFPINYRRPEELLTLELELDGDDGRYSVEYCFTLDFMSKSNASYYCRKLGTTCLSIIDPYDYIVIHLINFFSVKKQASGGTGRASVVAIWLQNLRSIS